MGDVRLGIHHAYSLGNAVEFAIRMGGNDGDYDLVGKAHQCLPFFADFFLVYAELVGAVCLGDRGETVLDFQYVLMGVVLASCGDLVYRILVQGQGFACLSVYCDLHCGAWTLEKEPVAEKQKQGQDECCHEKDDVPAAQSGNGGLLLIWGGAGMVHMFFLSACMRMKLNFE